MKVGIITLNGHFNYGNRLQNYALQFFLSKFVDEVDSIWYDKDIYLPMQSLSKEIFTKKYLKFIIKYILNWAEVRTKHNILKKYYGIECIREYNIKKFSDRYINIKYDCEITNDFGKDYDYFIVGSDQVWNPHPSQAYIKYLKFVPTKKRIAYAVSFGRKDVPFIRKKVVEKGLDGFNTISVREKAGAAIVKKFTGKDVPVLVDPTLLLSRLHWHNIAKKPKWYKNEKYILTYFLGKPSTIIKRLSEKYNWKIFNMMDRKNFNIYVSEVEEFLYLIENAQLICTDSFHGTVFSILFNRPFLVLNRVEKSMPDMTSRIDTLLELFGYQDRYIVNGRCNLSDEEILHMDFSNVESIQKREIERSTEYIKKALDLK